MTGRSVVRGKAGRPGWTWRYQTRDNRFYSSMTNEKRGLSGLFPNDSL